MIAVTRLDGSPIVVNVDLVERIEQTPDTMIVMVGGERLRVRESPEELIRRAMAFKRAVIAGPHLEVPGARGDHDGYQQ